MNIRPIVFVALAALGLLISACEPSAPETVEVQLTEFGIESSATTFRAGQAYQFVITNAGALNHEFAIMPPISEMGMQMEGHEMGDGMDHDMVGAMLHVSEDQLTPGASVTVEFTFSEEFMREDLEFACHLAGHYEGGMQTPIAIEG